MALKKYLITASLAAALSMPVLGHAESVKIGFVTTLTTPAGVIGEDMKNAVNLAVEHLGGKMSGKNIEVLFEDDGFKP